MIQVILTIVYARPTAEALLKHPFFKTAKKKSHLVATILQNLPPVNERVGKNAAEIEKRERAGLAKTRPRVGIFEKMRSQSRQTWKRE